MTSSHSVYPGYNQSVGWFGLVIVTGCDGVRNLKCTLLRVRKPLSLVERFYRITPKGDSIT